VSEKNKAEWVERRREKQVGASINAERREQTKRKRKKLHCHDTCRRHEETKCDDARSFLPYIHI
jgi:hypothetical protein